LKDAQPLVSASVKFYEITVKVVVLTAAIIYLGLFTGMTVSVSISAAVASRAARLIIGEALMEIMLTMPMQDHV
jgi:uncharacterized oligopeptide transporter (OPT) family protein